MLSGHRQKFYYGGWIWKLNSQFCKMLTIDTVDTLRIIYVIGASSARSSVLLEMVSCELAFLTIAKQFIAKLCKISNSQP